MSTPIDERTLRTAAALGIDACGGAKCDGFANSLSQAALRIHAVVAPGQVALIAGPSGAGKSTLLRLLARRPHTETARPLRPSQERARVAALCRRMSLGRWSRLLARFGLAEGRVLVPRSGDLSAGERARLELALAAARCETTRA
ncbi:MAG TPA: ATP-binding cassette domain-containing protein, partial [Phycisphaerales bacterium]|nr:ATP-binding cassette domain-containing protein [Phycisphaerales bacterium]